MEAKQFIDILNDFGVGFYTGVPDSLLNAFCFQLINAYGLGAKHKVGVNEGSCLAMAAGNYMATQKIPCVYMQNSGLGNIVNPANSLINPKVCGIPVLFVVGWRGEPGVKDEPQHIFQGEVTLSQLTLLGIEYAVIDKDTAKNGLQTIMTGFKRAFAQRKSCAIIIKKDTFSGAVKSIDRKAYEIVREKAIERIALALDPCDIVISSTGKISRELFEIRERNGQHHDSDFLTVGSMGYASSIALEIACVKKDRRVLCLDGDGAALMHMGAMATIGNIKPQNFTHIILDNAAHETVGGVPTVSDSVDWISLAKSVGYSHAQLVTEYRGIEEVLSLSGTVLGLIKVNHSSRKDLGRPTLTARQTADNFMGFLGVKNENSLR